MDEVWYVSDGSVDEIGLPLMAVWSGTVDEIGLLSKAVWIK